MAGSRLGSRGALRGPDLDGQTTLRLFWFILTPHNCAVFFFFFLRKQQQSAAMTHEAKSVRGNKEAGFKSAVDLKEAATGAAAGWLGQKLKHNTCCRWAKPKCCCLVTVVGCSESSPVWPPETQGSHHARPLVFCVGVPLSECPLAQRAIKRRWMRSCCCFVPQREFVTNVNYSI